MVEFFLIPAVFYAAVHDFMFYKIPNWLTLLIIIVFMLKSLVSIYMGAPFSILVDPSISFVVVLLIGFILFSFKVYGAGDAKLMAACALWTSEINIYHFMILVTFSGGVLAITYIFFKNPLAFIRQLLLAKIVNKYGNVPLIIKNENMVPYAVAIFAGVLWLVLKK